jgi:hypothetical protein
MASDYDIQKKQPAARSRRSRLGETEGSPNESVSNSLSPLNVNLCNSGVLVNRVFFKITQVYTFHLDSLQTQGHHAAPTSPLPIFAMHSL